MITHKDSEIVEYLFYDKSNNKHYKLEILVLRKNMKNLESQIKLYTNIYCFDGIDNVSEKIEQAPIVLVFWNNKLINLIFVGYGKIKIIRKNIKNLNNPWLTYESVSDMSLTFIPEFIPEFEKYLKKEKIEGRFPILYNEKEYYENDCNELFLMYYDGFDTLDGECRVYSTDKMYIYPDGKIDHED